MKRTYIIIVSMFVSLNIYAQTTNDVILKVKELQQESGDSIARDYLIKNRSLFENDNDQAVYLGFWGQLTSNMWNANPTPSLTEEFKSFLMSIVDESAYSEEFIPEESALPWVWQMTHDYSNILYAEGNKEKALFMLSRIHQWFKSYPNFRNTIGYAQSLLNYCLILVRDMHKYVEGEPLLKEYAEVAEKVYGENSAQYAVAIYNMCFTPNKTTEERIELTKKAISIYETAEFQDPAMLKQMKDTYNAHIAAVTGISNTSKINNVSNTVLPMNECTELIMSERGAEAIESLLYYKNLLLKDQYLDTLRYSEIISYVISAYMQINDLPAAQKEIEDFHTLINIDKLPSNYAAIFYSSAGLVAMRLKDYPKALRYSHAACKICEQSSITDIEYCKILGNISLIYGLAAESISKQFYLDAKWYIDEAISVFEERIGSITQHGATGLTLLSNKAYIYDALGERQESIKTYETIVSDFGNNNDVKGPWLLAANNLAVLYMKSGASDKAIGLLKSLSSKNKEYKQLFSQNLALAYYVSGDANMKNSLKEYNSICYNNCMDIFNFFTPAEREDYWTGNARELLVLNNLFADRYPETTDVAYDNLLFVKNLKIMSSDILKDIVENSNDLTLQKKYGMISALRDAISYRSSERDSLKIWTQKLQEEERNILGMIPDYKEKLLGAFHSWREIKDALKENEIAVDFTYVPKMKDWDHADGYYGVFVLTKESSRPELVSLCEVDSINKHFIGTSQDAQQISLFYKDSSSLYKMLWGNLESYIKGKTTIYFSPTGQLNLLNHNALLMPNGEAFGNCYNLVRLSSTDKILSLDSKDRKYQSAVVYGGILYDLSVADMREAANQYSHHGEDQFLLAMRSEDERGHWNYLPGTKTESQNIYSLLTSNNISTKLLQEKEANEESFKALSGNSPQIIHLSTHGFFLDTTDKVKKNPFMNNVGNYSDKEDKLIRTGVLMAGANNVWCGKNQVTGIEDGILTADEISRLDLSGTKLVVLSACETAKGQIDEIDGVLGLQRGLKKAGVGSILMSLWKVSDAVTSILMTQFYENIGKGIDSRESLKNAAQKVKEQYPDPYFWASFVMLD